MHKTGRRDEQGGGDHQTERCAQQMFCPGESFLY
jgi:hypothetical protein